MHNVMYVQIKYYDEHELETLRGSSSPEVGTNWNHDVLNFFPSFRQIGLRGELSRGWLVNALVLE